MRATSKQPTAVTVTVTRVRQEEMERIMLADYGVKSGESKGRHYSEKSHPLRSEFQRDRARVIHSKAFRRLEYKTQVFLNGTGDHLRTRLTHTIEVASISRTIARALGLNEDLTETIALAHDLGHSPFGHSGEARLNRLMRDHGGFEHNRQSLRIVEEIERKYPRFRGINLTHEVLEGLRKHDDGFVFPGSDELLPNPSLEAQVANLADAIAYYSHDLDDGLDEGLLNLEELSGLQLWSEAMSKVQTEHPRARPAALAPYAIRCLIDSLVEDLLATTASNIAKADVHSVDDVRRFPRRLAGFSPAKRRGNAELRKFLYQNLYYNERVKSVNDRACRMLEAVFRAILARPSLLPIEWRKRVKTAGLERTLCDYISGMTDHYLLQTHSLLFPARA
jgi:dGTPase